MRRIFMGLLFLSLGIMVGCDKEIKEAARPAALPAGLPALPPATPA